MTTRLLPDVPAILERVAARIEDDPDAYDQDNWGEVDRSTECGTRACIAGHVLLEAGYDLSRSPFSVFVHRDTRKRAFPPTEAAAVLGLTRAEAEYLFAGAWVPTGVETFADLEDHHLTAKRVAADLRAFAAGADVFTLGRQLTGGDLVGVDGVAAAFGEATR